ncbi:MAG: hypothetical protein EAY65_05115 [Alphaproteobacteria bacterium]|nr:MAG: hypothetical protein EAY65_05115 [Alphaproteobacteria bacterium]
MIAYDISEVMQMFDDPRDEIIGVTLNDKAQLVMRVCFEHVAVEGVTHVVLEKIAHEIDRISKQKGISDDALASNAMKIFTVFKLLTFTPELLEKLDEELEALRESKRR